MNLFLTYYWPNPGAASGGGRGRLLPPPTPDDFGFFCLSAQSRTIRWMTNNTPTTPILTPKQTNQAQFVSTMWILKVSSNSNHSHFIWEDILDLLIFCELIFIIYIIILNKFQVENYNQALMARLRISFLYVFIPNCSSVAFILFLLLFILTGIVGDWEKLFHWGAEQAIRWALHEKVAGSGLDFDFGPHNLKAKI